MRVVRGSRTWSPRAVRPDRSGYDERGRPNASPSHLRSVPAGARRTSPPAQQIVGPALLPWSSGPPAVRTSRSWSPCTKQALSPRWATSSRRTSTRSLVRSFVDDGRQSSRTLTSRSPSAPTKPRASRASPRCTATSCSTSGPPAHLGIWPGRTSARCAAVVGAAVGHALPAPRVLGEPASPAVLREARLDLHGRGDTLAVPPHPELVAYTRARSPAVEVGSE